MVREALRDSSPCGPTISPLILRRPRTAAVSKDVGPDYLRPDPDFRLGVGIGLHLAKGTPVLARHPLAELRQPFLPVREDLDGAPGARRLGMARDQDMQPLDVGVEQVLEHVDLAMRLEIAGEAVDAVIYHRFRQEGL